MELNTNVAGGAEGPVDPVLAALEARLDDLARHERGAMPAGLEARLVQSGMSEIRAGSPAGVVARIGPRARTPGRRLAAGRLAASVLVVVGIGAAFLSQHRSNPAPVADLSIEQDVEGLLALSNGFVGDLAAQADGLESDTLELRAMLLSDSGAGELLAEEGAL